MGLENPQPFNVVDLNDNNLHVDGRTLVLGAIFLLLLLVSIFSFLYFIFVYVRRQGQSGGAATNTRPPPGLDKAAINCLPIVSYGSSPSLGGVAGRIGECSICLVAFQDGEKVKMLPPCHHGFHSQCVDKWLQTRSSCPVCRATVVRVDSFAQSDVP